MFNDKPKEQFRATRFLRTRSLCIPSRIFHGKGKYDEQHPAVKFSIHFPGNLMLQVEQKGSNLVLMDENGSRTNGGFEGYDGVYAENGRYGNHGRIGINVDGTFFQKKEAERTFSGTPERDRDWNFIRWEDGTLCVKPRNR